MRFDKLTIRSQELIANAQSLAEKQNNQQIEPEHIVLSMLKDKEGIANTIFRKLGASPDEIEQKFILAVDNMPKITGTTISDTYLKKQKKS